MAHWCGIDNHQHVVLVDQIYLRPLEKDFRKRTAARFGECDILKKTYQPVQVVYTGRVRRICVQDRVVDATYKEEVAEFLTMIVFSVVAGGQAVGQG